MLPRQIEATENVLTSSSLLESLKAKNLVAHSNHNFGQIQTAITVHVVDAEKKSHLRIWGENIRLPPVAFVQRSWTERTKVGTREM